MGWYVQWVSDNLILSAFIQFALLGTVGEVLGVMVAGRKPSGKAGEWFIKALVWGVLGILVKYAFTGYKGFAHHLVDVGMLPVLFDQNDIARALLLSVLANSMFGPLLMVLHRTTDNLITGTHGYTGIEKSLATLAWFWVPAHAVTFALPAAFQMGLAALWSVALGVIMGFTKRQK